MNSPTSNIIHRTNNSDRPLNILLSSVHERYQENLDRTGNNFYLCHHPTFRKWDTSYAKIPPNHYTLDWRLPLEEQIPDWLNLDLILSGNKWDNFQAFCPLSRKLHIPFIQLEHTACPEAYSPEMINQMKNMRGDLNCFISDFSLDSWQIDNRKDCYVVYHCVDTETFRPTVSYDERERICLSVANDFINRNYFLNYELWRDGTYGLPTKLYGHTPGLSERAKSTKFLAEEYSKALIFVNTSRLSPIPMSVLESMASSCIVITTKNCAIPEFIQHGYNGLFCNTALEFQDTIKKVLAEPEDYYHLGENARKTILEKFNEKIFVDKWNQVFRKLL